jgi:hypothetical protein
MLETDGLIGLVESRTILCRGVLLFRHETHVVRPTGMVIKLGNCWNESVTSSFIIMDDSRVGIIVMRSFRQIT